MEELVSLDKIKAQVEAFSWQEAVFAAGQLLIDSGDIEKAYLDDMVRSVEQYGPYMVISKGFALAHAAPCEAVKRSAVSLINLKEGVEFGSPNDPVKVVMCLACVDKESHIGQLQKIARKLMVEGTIDKLAESETAEELYRIINDKEVDEL